MRRRVTCRLGDGQLPSAPQWASGVPLQSLLGSWPSGRIVQGAGTAGSAGSKVHSQVRRRPRGARRNYLTEPELFSR